MPMTPGEIAYKIAYQASPIILVGGIAQSLPGGVLPIVLLLQPLQFLQGLLSGGSDVSLDSFFANFQPAAGSTLILNDVGRYPFANQAVAANAMIAQPRNLTMLMTCPAQGPLGYAAKTIVMVALVAALNQHIAMGGTFTVLTPSSFLPNGLLLAVRDVTGGESKQVQSVWAWEFEFPLLTLNQAQAAQNSLMAKFGSGTQINGDPAWSGTSPTVGDPNSLAGPSLIPAATNTPAANVAPVSGTNLPPVAGAQTSNYNIVGPMSTPSS